eukprot:767004-Hanusia_phi.AAC.7
MSRRHKERGGRGGEGGGAWREEKDGEDEDGSPLGTPSVTHVGAKSNTSRGSVSWTRAQEPKGVRERQ